MPASSALFYGSLAFLLGVLLASLGLTLEVVLVTAALAAAFVAFGVIAEKTSHGNVRLTKSTNVAGRLRKSHMFALAALTPLIIAGAVFYHFDEVRFRASAVPLGTQSFQGVVVNDPVLREGYRPAVVRLNPLDGRTDAGRILANLPPYPEVRYGDELSLAGVVKQPESEGYARYLAKERVSGVMNRPTATIVARGRGSLIQSALFTLKHSATGVFARVLPAEDAAFLSGLTVGERGAFSKELKDAMQRSGTTHLVALSGYNIGILGQTVMAAALWLAPRRRVAFVLTVAALISFVCMAGAEASVVRAAIMGVLFLVAKQSGRLFDVRQAIVLAGVAMVIVNPKVLAFDAGFQLSFLAFLGIAYLFPVIAPYLRVGRPDRSFLEWRTALSETAAAQLAVAPLLIAQFGMMSLTSLAANLLILAAVPVTMGVGFLAAALGAASTLAAQIVGLVAWVLTRYEVGVIRLFSLISIPITPAVSWVGATAYYALLVGVAVWVTYHHANPVEA